MSASSLPKIQPPFALIKTTIGALCDQYGGSVQTGPFGGQLHASDYSLEGIPVVMPQDLVDGRVSVAKVARVQSDHVNRLQKHKLQAGDIVFSRRGDVGRFAVTSDHESGWLCGTGCIRIRLNCPDLDIAYVRHFLARSETSDWLFFNAKGVTMANLNTDIIRSLPLVFPPLDAQKRIAAILDKAYALRAKRRQAIALLDSLTQSIFLEMFGDLTQWPTLKLAELADEFRYGTSEKSQAVGHPTLRIPNVVGGSVSLSDLKFVPVNERELDRLRLQDGDILFVRTNGNKDYVGRSAVMTTKIESGTDYVLSDFIYASYLIRARVKRDVVNPHFLQAFLSGAAGRKMLLERAKTSAGQYNINTEGLGSINIPIPPIGKQDAFQSTIEKLSENLDASRLNLSQVDVLFASLQHRAFTGQL
ncbi:restriction endonuclease subunit S [Agrobacterium leguminum]|uniref:restriction endonuclease subunit S n=1 Tax=Agrobacterium leguminum TaxID=2792015 RepID=UPI003CE5A459